MFYLILRKIIGSINLPKACGPRSQTQLMFCLTLRQLTQKYQFTQSMWFMESGMTKVLFDTQENNFEISIYPRYVVRGDRHNRGSVWYSNKQQKAQHTVMNQNMVKKAFISNNIFSSCLNSRGVVQPFPLNLQDNMHLCQLLM